MARRPWSTRATPRCSCSRGSARSTRAALILCAGAAQLEVVERLVHERGFDGTRVAGSAPEALRCGLVALASLEARSAPREVSLMLVGRPPRQAIAMWNDASIAGRRATDVLDPPALTRLDARLPQLWPPGPLTLAGAAVRVASLALTHGAGTPSLFVVPRGTEGVRVRGVALPATVRAEGIRPSGRRCRRATARGSSRRRPYRGKSDSSVRGS